MTEDFLSKDLPSAKLADELNQLGKDGWLIVNCWPASPQTVTCVFRRPRVYFCTNTKRYEPARRLALLTLEAALVRCINEPKRKETKTLKDVLSPTSELHSISLAKLGEEFCASEEEVASRLKECGLKESTKSPGSFSAFVDDQYLWIYRKTATAPWVLYAKKKGSSTDKPTAPRKKGIDSSEPSASAKPFSVDLAIAECIAQPPKKAGYDHSIPLSTAAKNQNSDLPSALEAFKQIGLPTADPKSKEKRYVEHDGHVIALVEWKPGVWFLNIKSTKVQTS